MSVIFVVVPAVVVGWPILCGAVAAAAATLGYKALKTGQEIELGNNMKLDIERLPKGVTIPLEDSQVIGETMARESQFTIDRGDIAATFSRGADGRVCVHVAGENKTESELETLGQELVGRVTQQYAYNKVVTELKQQGFTVTSEEVANDQTIRIHVSKYV